MDIINNEKTYPQLVEVVKPIEIDFNSGDSLLVDLDPQSDFTTGTRLKVEQNDVSLHDSVFVKPTINTKINVFVDNVIARWTDSNQYTHTEIYPITLASYDSVDVNSAVNINSIMGSYKGMIESIVSSGTTFSITFNYHVVNYDKSVLFNSYSQTFTKS